MSGDIFKWLAVYGSLLATFNVAWVIHVWRREHGQWLELTPVKRMFPTDMLSEATVAAYHANIGDDYGDALGDPIPIARGVKAWNRGPRDETISQLAFDQRNFVLRWLNPYPTWRGLLWWLMRPLKVGAGDIEWTFVPSDEKLGKFRIDLDKPFVIRARLASGKRVSSRRYRSWSTEYDPRYIDQILTSPLP